MAWFIKASVVIVTLTFVAVVSTTALVLFHLREAAARLTSAVRASVIHFLRIVRDTEELIPALSEPLPPARSTIERGRSFSHRSANRLVIVGPETVQPVFTGLVVARGVESRTDDLVPLQPLRTTPPLPRRNPRP
jgi:hypothetical protein